MKITDKTLVDRVFINDIQVGEVFFIEDTEELFLKLDSNLFVGSNWEESSYALNLDNYKVYEIGYTEPLRKVNSELILT